MSDSPAKEVSEQFLTSIEASAKQLALQGYFFHSADVLILIWAYKALKLKFDKLQREYDEETGAR